MAITYENVIDRVLDGVSDLLATEFPGTGIFSIRLEVIHS